MDSEKESLNSQISHLQGQVSIRTSEVATLTNQVQTLTAKAGDNTLKLKQKEEQIIELRNQAKQLEEKLAIAIAEKHKAELNIEELNRVNRIQQDYINSNPKVIVK